MVQCKGLAVQIELVRVRFVLNLKNQHHQLVETKDRSEILGCKCLELNVNTFGRDL